MNSEKVWFVTGATRGIGAEIAKAALAAGHRLVATGRDRTALDAVFGADHPRVLTLALDVAREADAQQAVAATLARFGRIDVLVNNAGYGLLGGFESLDTEAIERQFATNVPGLFHVTRAALPAMRHQRAGQIFNLSSVGGMVGYAGASVYVSTKFAVEGFSESLAMEVAAFGIGVTIVEPGFFRTDFLDNRSVQYGGRSVDTAYDASAAQWRDAYEAYNHRQLGDPAKLGIALVALANEAKPPLRFAAGSDAYAAIGQKLASVRAEMDRWHKLSVSTDHVQESVAA